MEKLGGYSVVDVRTAPKWMVRMVNVCSRCIPGRSPRQTPRPFPSPDDQNTVQSRTGQYRLLYSEHWIIIPDERQENLYKASRHWLLSWLESHSLLNSNTFQISGINGNSDLKMIQPDPERTPNGNGTSSLNSGDTAQFIKLPDVSLYPIVGQHSLTIAKTASYPTGSLDFLIKLRKEQAQQEAMEQASLLERADKSSRLSLKIVIVGAGLGGLAAAIALSRRGHKVTVVEQAPFLAEVSWNCGFTKLENLLSFKSLGRCWYSDPLEL
jgi:hypothetical protein